MEGLNNNSSGEDSGATRQTAWDSLGEEVSSKKRKMSSWETLEAQANRDLLPDGLVRWLEGVDPVSLRPKPFDVDLHDFLDEGELRAATAGKTMAEHREIVARNQEAIVHNNEELDAFSEHVIQISEMSSEELEAFCHDEKTSDSDKSIASCIGVIRDYYRLHEDFGDTGLKMFDAVRKATESIYGFGVVEAQEILRKRGSHFKILTSKEHEAVVPGSLEDIASAALESFVANPDYENARIREYDEYLYGIQLDCTKRRVVKEKGVDVIKEEIDLDEFQARVMESMSGVVFSDDSPDKVFTESEHADMSERIAKMRMDHAAGRHFYTKQEERAKTYSVEPDDGRNLPKAAFIPSERDVKGRSDFIKRIRRSCKEVFKYSERLAAAEMKPWAEKIDFDKVESINNDENLTIEEKFIKITAYIQGVLGVQNLDENGQSQPIPVKWFRFKDPRKKDKKPANVPPEDEDLPEKYAGAYYSRGENSIYYNKLRLNRLKQGGRLTDWDISTVAHEMWHAKQAETIRTDSDKASPTERLKARMYRKNNYAYQGLEPRGSNRAYYMQIKERESYALGAEVESLLKKHRAKKFGEKVLDVLRRVGNVEILKAEASNT